MASRTAVPGTISTGSVLTAANINNLPGGSIGYSRITSDSNQWASTATAITGLSVTVTVNASRRIKIVAHGVIETGVTEAVADLYLFEGAFAFCRDRGGGYAGSQQWTFHLEHTLNPSAGSHTYFLKGDRATGSANQYVGASSDAGSGNGPAWIEVFDVGPSY